MSALLSAGGKRYRTRYIGNTLLAVLIIAGFWVRVNGAFFPSYHTTDAYLVGSHILKYMEIPLTKDWGPSWIFAINSPVYYFVVAGLLALYRDVSTLWVAHALLLSTTSVLVFILCRPVFGWPSAVLSVLFFQSISFFNRSAQLGFKVSSIVLPLAVAAFALLSYGYLRKKYPYLIWGVVLFVMGCSIHYSLLLAAPIYMVLVLFVLRRISGSVIQYSMVIASILCTICVMFGTVMYYQMHNHWPLIQTVRMYSGTGMPPFTLQMFISYLGLTIVQFMSFVFGRLHENVLYYVLLVLIFVALLIHFIISSTPVQKKYLLILCAGIISYILLFSIFQDKPLDYYFVAIYPLWGMVCGVLFGSFIQQKTLIRRGIGTVCILFILYLTASDMFDYRAYRMNRNLLVRHTILNPEAESIKNTVITIKAKEGYPTASFFRIWTYIYGSTAPTNDQATDAQIWASLENHFHERFVRVSDEIQSNYVQKNDKYYIFIICFFHPNLQEESAGCITPFLRQNPAYILLDHPYAVRPFSIYVAKNVAFEKQNPHDDDSDIQNITQTIVKNPYNLGAYRTLAQMYRSNGYFLHAKAVLQQAGVIDPTQEWIYADLAELYDFGLKGSLRDDRNLLKKFLKAEEL